MEKLPRLWLGLIRFPSDFSVPVDFSFRGEKTDCEGFSLWGFQLDIVIANLNIQDFLLHVRHCIVPHSIESRMR